MYGNNKKNLIKTGSLKIHKYKTECKTKYKKNN